MVWDKSLYKKREVVGEGGAGLSGVRKAAVGVAGHSGVEP